MTARRRVRAANGQPATLIGPDPDNPTRNIVRLDNGELCATTTTTPLLEVIDEQWFMVHWNYPDDWANHVPNGIVTAWPDAETAHAQAAQRNAPVGRIVAITVTTELVGTELVVLTDADGRPLRGAR